MEEQKKIIKRIYFPGSKLMTVNTNNELKQELIEFKLYMLTIWLNDLRWGQNITFLYMCESIKNKLNSSDKYIDLTIDEMAILLQIIETPQKPYLPIDSSSILAFYEAVKNAQSIEEVGE